MTFQEQVRSHCAEKLVAKLRFESLVHIRIESLQLAIIFIFSAWSGAAVSSFRLLTEALNEIYGHTFDIVVVDADKINFDTFQNIFGELPQGKGETYWIKAGQLLHADHGYTQTTKEALRDRIREFVA